MKLKGFVVLWTDSKGVELGHRFYTRREAKQYAAELGAGGTPSRIEPVALHVDRMLGDALVKLLTERMAS